MLNAELMKTALAQLAPVFLDRDATIAKVVEAVRQAARQGCELVAFGESLVPAYPIWLSRTDGARFNSPDQKRLHALYVDQAVVIGTRGDLCGGAGREPAGSAIGTEPGGHLAPVCRAARDSGIAVIMGVAERALDRGGHTLYCSRVFIEGRGERAGRIGSVHRKLMPTYEERLAWGIGDGAGLVTHRVGPFTVGALNCWENWLPSARMALYAAGEDVHVMLWPGSVGLTQDITRFVAMESRSFVLSASAILRAEDIPADVPERARMVGDAALLYDGGSCVAGPDGQWIVEPVAGREDLIIVELDPARVREERQNFDPAGHYARPDVLRLTVDRRPQAAADWLDAEA
ncbi:MAG: carbon-nitrogen hydrolase family protein [Planctomycetes bacterium]|nr:carbon-nitrogen hydrolase family protein [Planctomycetota bacterium]